MSASFFDTILTADARTKPGSASGAQYAAAGTQQPRWGSGESDPWAAVHLHAETVLQVAAQTLSDTPMDGLTGDHPDKRHHLATIIDAVAHAVRELALDADGDGAVSDADWAEALRLIGNAVAVPFPLPENLARRTSRIEVIAS